MTQWPAPVRRPGPGPVGFFVVLLVVLGLTLAALQLVPPDPAPTITRSPRPTASSSASVPSGTHSQLTDNPLYRATISGSCPTIHKTDSKSAYKKQVDTLLTCLARIYKPLVEQADGRFAPVGHTFFGKAVDTPCGRQSGAYAFYCESDATIYFSEQVYTDSRYARLSVADTVIHEYGHHVQSMVGIFDAADSLTESNQVTIRREELQVYCWTYYVFASLPSFQLTDTDRSFFLDLWSHTSDPDGHGSVKAQQYWGSRGLDAKNLGACNTFSVPKTSVR